MLKETDVRKKIKDLKTFYEEVIRLILINFILMLVWLFFDRTGLFWPKYAMALSVTLAFWRAYRLDVFNLIFHRTSFLNQNWEERKFREVMRRQATASKKPADKDKVQKD